MNNQNQSQNQSTRQNFIAFTGNVSQVKPLQNGGAAISLAYNEGKKVNGQWQQKDTIFMECIVPKKFNFIPNVGDKMTIEGFLCSDNYQPQVGNKRYGVKIMINNILDHSVSTKPAQQQGGYQQPAQQQGGFQQPAQQQGGYQQPAQQQGGFQQPAQQQGDYQQPAQQQGGYQQPAQQQGGFQQPAQQQGGFQQPAQQQGGFQQPAQQQGGFQQRGGFRPQQ